MEMPEINKDILGEESNSEVLNQADDSGNLDESELQAESQLPDNLDSSQESLDKGKGGEKNLEKQEENQESLDSLNLPKIDDESIQKIQSVNSFPENGIKKQVENDDDDEPVQKKQKLDIQDQDLAEQLQHLDQKEQQEQQQQPTSQDFEMQPEAQPSGEEPEIRPDDNEIQDQLMDVEKSNEEPEKILITKDEEKKTSGPDTDMLATLASAALEQDPKDKNTAGATPKSPVIKSEPETPKKKMEMWCNVGVFDTNTTIVSDYLATPEPNEHVDLETATLGGRRIQLEPGTAYKFRVCAVNGCGTGPWSDVAAFKTTLPGFPGAPSAIKISKSPEGAHLTWEPPGGNSSDILEYAVYLAVRSASQDCQPVTTNQAQLAFVRVFCGPTNKCMVGTNSLQAAHIDTTTKPAIIFRIAARNSKGYGPATQVRWLQESQNGTAQAAKRGIK